MSCNILGKQYDGQVLQLWGRLITSFPAWKYGKKHVLGNKPEFIRMSDALAKYLDNDHLLHLKMAEASPLYNLS